MKSVTRKSWVMFLAIALGNGVATMAQAGEATSEKPGTSPMTTSSQPPVIERASKIIGLLVKDKAGVDLGVVREIVLAPDRTAISYLEFLPYGSSLGDGKFTRAPIDKVTLAADRSYFTYDYTRAQATMDAAAPDPALPWSQRVTSLLGLRVNDSYDHDAGTIRDLLVDVPNHTVTKATIATGGVLGFGRRLASVDWNGLTVDSNERAASIAMTTDELHGIAYKADAYWDQLGFVGEGREPPMPPVIIRRSSPDQPEENKVPDSPRDDKPQDPVSPFSY